jgi:peptidoglycan/LPS O-acetylase OafA/YrhL
VTTNPKIPLIQHLRALSVVLVIAFHFGLFAPNGFIGVDIFFVISGYVITQSLLRNRALAYKSHLRSFYLRRIARLFPAFFVVTLVTALCTALFLSPQMGVQQNAVKTYFFSIFALSNYAIPQFSGDYFGTGVELNPFTHTWSLSVEEQFYFLFPLLFLILIRFKMTSKPLFLRVVLTLSILASFSLLIPISFLTLLSNFGTTAYYSPQARFWEFLCGALVAIESKRVRRSKFFIVFIQSSSIGIICFCAFSPSIRFQENMFLLSIPVIATSILLLFMQADISVRREPSSRLSKRVHAASLWIGDSSYSLYLWHWPVLVFSSIFIRDNLVLKVISAIIMTFILSWLTTTFVENRINFAKYSNLSFWVKFFGIGQLVSLLLFGLMSFGVTSGWKKEWALNSHKVISAGCDAGALDFDKCSWGNKNRDIHIIVSGDSVAWGIADAFVSYAERNNQRIVSTIRNGCAISLSSDSMSDDECSNWRKKVVVEIRRVEPEIVVLANSIGYSKDVLNGVSLLIADLLSRNIKVILAYPPPGGDEYSALRSLGFRPGSENRDKRIGKIDYFSKLSLEKFSGNPNLAIYDPSFYLCNPRCVVARNGEDYYNYGGHLSVYANRILYPSIETTILGLIANKP